MLGLIPGVGDALGLALSAWVAAQARQAGASRWLLARMAMNVGLDAVLGSVPLLGDVFDFAFKANRRNLRLLQRHLARTGGAAQARRRS